MSRAEADKIVWDLSAGRASDTLRASSLEEDLIGLRGMTEEVTRDYAGRMVAELVQNAHDAHERSRTDGRIEIVYDADEGRNGTLYVANTGRPFTYKDLRSISLLGGSSKKPGEGIGSKGIGFKSVYLATSRPEVYSRTLDPSGDKTDWGFCFSFAQPDDYLRLAGNDGAEAKRLQLLRHPGGLPVPARDRIPPRVERLANAGHRVVVRLPVVASARDDVLEQLGQLVSGEAPTMLFLERVQSLTVEVVGDARGRQTLMRRSSTIAATRELTLHRVELGPQGTYVVGAAEIAPERFRRELRASVEAGRLDPRWLAWSDPAVVSVAVRADGETEDDRLYSFLPMGPKERSPMHGHVNGPFSVAIARKELVEHAGLNDLILDVAAEICIGAIPLVRELPEVRRVLPDLLCWKSDHYGRLETAARRRKLNLREVRFVPMIGEPVMAAPSGVWRWQDADLAEITSSQLASTGIRICDPDTAGSRMARLTHFIEGELGLVLDPDPDTVATWAERIARRLAGESRHGAALSTRDRWLRFYDDLDHLDRRFSGLARSLAEAAIVITAGGDLVPCAPGRTGRVRKGVLTVFFRPGTDADDDGDDAGALDLPRSLGSRIAFPHPDLVWIETVGSVRRNRPGRELLGRAGVRPWRLEAIFQDIRDLLESRRDTRVWADALRFVFASSRRNERSRQADVSRAGLRVPSRGGWIPATSARFGARWPVTFGDRLARFLAECPSHPEFDALRASLLESPASRTFEGDVSEWVEFLRRAGVRDGLEPVDLLPQPLSLSKTNASPRALAERFGIHGPDAERWIAAAARADQPTRRSPWVVRGPLWWVPGQGAHHLLGSDARQRFAELVVRGVAEWPASVGWFRVEQNEWPTPAGAFLRNAEWLPVARPGDAAVGFTDPANAWHYLDDEDGLPAFAPMLAQPIRRAVSADARIWERLRTFGLTDWGDPAASRSRVRFLTGLATDARVRESHRHQFIAAYERSWGRIADRRDALPWESGEQPRFVVTVAGALGVHNGATDRRKLYLLTDADPLAESLIEERSVARFRVPARCGAWIAEQLRPRFAGRLVAVSHSSMTIVLDGDAVRPRATDPGLVSVDRDWLTDLVTLAIVLLERGDSSVAGIARSLARLRRIRVRLGRQLRLGIRESSLEEDAIPAAVVPVPHDRWPTIVAVDAAGPGLSDGLTWAQLEAFAPAIATLMGRPGLDVVLRYVVSKLADGRIGVARRPSREDLSDAFGVRSERIDEVLSANRDVLNRLAFLLRPVIMVWCGRRIAREFEPGEHQLDESALMGLLAKAGLPSPWTPATVLAAARAAEDFSALREALGISLGDLNRALDELGGPYRPIRYPEQHAAQFSAYLEDNREHITRSLRAANLSLVDEGSVPTRYVAAVAEFERSRRLDAGVPAKGVPRLEPDPAWLDEVETPSEAMMRSSVSAWLAALDVTEAPGRVRGLRDLEDTRTANRSRTESVAGRARAAIAAWCEANGAERPEWFDDGPTGLAHRLLDAGVLDFRPLKDESVLLWATRVAGCWPAGMPPALDPDALGLKPEALRAWEKRLAAIRDPRARAARGSVSLDKEQVSLEADDVSRLVELVDAGLSESLLGTEPEPATLADAPPLPERSGRERGPRRGRTAGMSDSQKLTVGFIGELVAFRWLQRHFSATADAWRSSLSSHLFPANLVDDSLGYDFALVVRGHGPDGKPVSRRRYFEVKAIGAPRDSGLLEVNFTEGEVTAAEQHADDDSYHVLLVVDALDSTKRSLHVLPNPWSSEGRKLFRALAAGRTLMFRLNGR